MSASHDSSTPAQLRQALRTPLNHVTGSAEMMLEDLHDSVVPPPSGLMEDLESTILNARELVKFMQNALPPESSQLGTNAVQNLQLWLRPHVNGLIEHIGGAQR